MAILKAVEGEIAADFVAVRVRGCSRAGLDPEQYSAHKLRHTAATLMVANGVDLRTVQEVLGHEHLNTTEIYTHIENTELKIAAEANPLSRPALKETHHEKDPVI